MGTINQLHRLPAPLLQCLCSRSLQMTRSFSLSTSRKASVGLEALDASKGGRERIVILGSGWAGEIASLQTYGPSLLTRVFEQAMFSLSACLRNTKHWLSRLDPTSYSPRSSTPQLLELSNFGPPLNPYGRVENQILNLCKDGQMMWILDSRS